MNKTKKCMIYLNSLNYKAITTFNSDKNKILQIIVNEHNSSQLF